MNWLDHLQRVVQAVGTGTIRKLGEPEFSVPET